MDDEDERVFNAIIVISDRKVLNKQLRETVRAYEKRKGLWRPSMARRRN